RAIDKELQNNFWSCGLDPKLKTYETDYDKETRQLMTRYAINDVFAPTCLYFLLEKKHCLFESPTSELTLTSTSLPSSSTLTSTIPVNMKQQILIYADSHAKNIAKHQPSSASSNFELTVDWLSGRRWLDTYTPHLSAIDSIVTPATSSSLSSISSLILLIATNSLRNVPYQHVILQVQNIITIIRQKFPHITSIAVVTCLPSTKVTHRLPTVDNLNANITNYNKQLKELAGSYNIHVIEPLITTDDLFDGLHIDNAKQHLLFDPIFQYCTSLANPSDTERSQLQQRDTHHQQMEVSNVNDAQNESTTLNNAATLPATTSTSTISPLSVVNDQQEAQQPKIKTKPIRTPSENNARNKIRHKKLKQKLMTNTITRPICKHWPMTLIKQVLHHHLIPCEKTPYPQNGKLLLRFKTVEQAKIANVDLPQEVFNEEQLQYWSHKQTEQ
ncbi:unnamed protein product, partial [Didymodactylos carnosus]